LKIIPTVNIQNAKAIPLFGAGEACCDPMAVVDFLLARGCHRMALVDVDAGRSNGHNRDLIARLMRRFHQGAGKACIQVGGGIRSSDQAQFFLDHGAAWLLVGTILQRSPLVVDQLLGRFRENLTAGLDARGGEIQASGWREASQLKPEAAGSRIKGHGFKRILFMDIPTAPAAAPDFQTARLIASSSHISMFMGGSIQTLEHLNQAMAMPGLQGVTLDACLLMENPALASALNLQHL
jgi:phosphoribosylformimino-5-aminoimidazole carboxamide ribotide isomerase